MTGQQARTVAIVPAAGLSVRFGPGTRKPFRVLCDKPVIVWSVEVLQQIEEIDEIIPVVRFEDTGETSELMEQYHLRKVKRVVPGGRERQDSVYNALMELDNSVARVLVHDGVRPLADSEIVQRVLDALEGADGVIPAVPFKDTVKTVREGAQADGKGRRWFCVERTLDRQTLRAVQTPQVFRFAALRDAFERAYRDGFYATDDAALLERYGGTVRVVMGSYRNIKITTAEDIAIAEALFSSGQG